MRGVYSATYVSSQDNTALLGGLENRNTAGVIELLSCSVVDRDSESNQMGQLSISRITVAGTTPVDQVGVGLEVLSTTATGFVVSSWSGAPTVASMPLYSSGFSTLAGWYYDPIPETRIILPASGDVALNLIMTDEQAEDHDLVISWTWREIG